MGGIKLRKGRIIAAGSVVTKDTKPLYIYAGNPARQLKPRFDNERDMQEHLKLEKNFLRKKS